MKTPTILQPIGESFDEVIDVLIQTDVKKTVFCKPFVKWVGGKRSIVEELKKRLPIKFNMSFSIFIYIDDHFGVVK